MLRGLRLSKSDRLLVRTVFSVSALSSIFAIVKTVCGLVYSPNQFKGLFMTEMLFQVRVNALACFFLIGRTAYNTFRVR